jgi:signal transduction histidine kinase
LDLVTRVDKFRLEQVFRNLFDNSLAACRDPVRIEVDCSQVTVNHLSQIRIHVRDNGPGLSIEQTQNVFEPFFTSKSNGTGLGMVISKRIVESHGGTITAGNSGVGGAEFIIILPGNHV